MIWLLPYLFPTCTPRWWCFAHHVQVWCSDLFGG